MPTGWGCSAEVTLSGFTFREVYRLSDGGAHILKGSRVMHVGARSGVGRILWLTLIALLACATVLGCGGAATPSRTEGSRPTPTVAPQLVASEVVGIVKNTLADRLYFEDRNCLGTFGVDNFLASYQGNGQWEVKTVGALVKNPDLIEKSRSW